MAATPYTRGLQRIGDSCYAWFEPPGSWGLANSGFLVSDGEVLVVDTQNDMPRARALRESVRQVDSSAVITTVVNTHCDGDHWFGNQFFEGARILATTEAAAEMKQLAHDPRRIRETALMAKGPALREFLSWRADAYDYEGWRPMFPTETFDGELAVAIGATHARLISVGPGHTTGDCIVHLPEQGVVFAGDLVFNRSTPMVWTGPVKNVIANLQMIVGLGADVVVPGHGPITDNRGVEELRDYLSMVEAYATDRFRAGDTPLQAFIDMNLGEYRLWAHSSRVFAAINAIYNELDPERAPAPFGETMEVVLAHDAY